MKLLPLIPFDMGGWFAYLTPSHPFVRGTPEAKEAQKLYAADRIRDNRVRGHRKKRPQGK